MYVYNVSSILSPDPFFVCVVHFKGEGDGTSKNSKRKQKRLNQKAVGDKKDAPQSKRKSVSSPDAKSTSSPAATASTQTNGSKIVANGKTATTQLPKGKGNTNSICNCAVPCCSFFKLWLQFASYRWGCHLRFLYSRSSSQETT